MVIEATFGKPEFVFPERQEVYDEMASWCRKELKQGRRLLLSGYKLGKAQELTKFCNDYLNEVPLVHEGIYANNQVYEENGVKLGNYELLSGSTCINRHDVIIIPPFSLRGGLMQAIQLSSDKKISSAVATGWQNRMGFSKAFPLSDHADFSQLIQYVQESNAKKVFTMHGFDESLANHLRKNLKVEAMPLSLAGQKTINEFQQRAV
ncbi:hypothetical protein HZB89_02340 [archaeon]|nr:hypothetical protein [archaeon]